MPGMDGFETMRRIFISPAEMPIVVIAGQQFHSGLDGDRIF